ncbi:hypothetical protein ACWF0M_00955 [Kribbella sp. NPDC055110]
MHSTDSPNQLASTQARPASDAVSVVGRVLLGAPPAYDDLVAVLS